MLDWNDLLCSYRIRDIDSQIGISKEEISIRNEFDRDYARIIYSSSVRRLQDKTQVFPLQQNDFIRTRLTHSLEVSSIGESIGWQIAEILHERGIPGFEEWKEAKRLPSLLKVSGLLHDLGNPPFGHFGEDVIKEWFNHFFDKSNSSSNSYLSINKERSEQKLEHGNSISSVQITDDEKNDFLLFDGNAQTIRILTKLQFMNEYGVNLTLGTLATLMKYPWPSHNKSQKSKFGYMKSETSVRNLIEKHVLKNKKQLRHPATFILEAADDIAYCMADLEDAVKKRLIRWDEIFTEDYKLQLKNVCSQLSGLYRGEIYSTRYKDMIRDIDNVNKNIPSYDLICIQYFKAFVQSIMVLAVIDRFIGQDYSKIMSGEFKTGEGIDDELLNIEPIKELLKPIKDITYDKAFASIEVLELELLGYTVITELLNLFIPAILKVDNTSRTNRMEQKLVRLISENFSYIQCLHSKKTSISFNKSAEDWKGEIVKLSDYEKIQIVVDYVTGMTDSYAVSLHKKLMNGSI